MPIFQTSHGPVAVHNWGYQLQGLKGQPLGPAALAAASHTLIVSDFSRDGTNANQFTQTEVDAIQGASGNATVAVAYISIGEVSDFRDEWDPAWTTNGKASGALTALAPDWAGPTNPDWPESRKVRYWDPDWQSLIANASGTGWLDHIVAQGFDAAYLDIVDAYYYWAVEAPASVHHAGDPVHGNEKDAAQRMIDFISGMTAHARFVNPDFFVIPQNGDFIIDALGDTDPARKAAYLDAIGAIGVEDVYFGGNADENNAFHPDFERIAALKRDFLGNHKPVFAVDYVNNPLKIGVFIKEAAEDGFIPFVAKNRQLDRMATPAGGTHDATNGENYLIGTSHRDVINSLRGPDYVAALGGNDVVRGGAGNDHIYGESGRDVLRGDAGNDRLDGGSGNDTLAGGAGRDSFAFTGHWGHDRVTDFHPGSDRIDLSGVAHVGAISDITIQASGSAALVRHGADTILLVGVDAADLTAASFSF